LVPLGIEVSDILPDHVNPPAAVVGLATIGPSITAPLLVTMSVDVTLVGERADFASAQYRLDDLSWQVWAALRGPSASQWVISGEPRTVEVANQTFPSYVFTVEATVPCP
jgi:hypothetical protein